MICWPATQELDHKVVQAGDPESRKCGQATQGTNHKVLHACLMDITECGPATQGTCQKLRRAGQQECITYGFHQGHGIRHTAALSHGFYKVWPRDQIISCVRGMFVLIPGNM